MKKGHLVLFFVFMVFYCFFDVFAEQQKYQRITKEKERVEESLLYAINYAAVSLNEVMQETDEVKLFIFRESFLRAWFVRLGISNREDLQKEWQMHLPLLAFLTEEGGYFYYADLKRYSDTALLEQTWSAQVPYQLTQNAEEDIRMLKMFLEEQVGDIISVHNYIARQQGVEYVFSVPYFLVEDREELHLPMLLVVFQGWPLEGSGSIVYEYCLDAGAYIKEK